jgi:hypothetical protein
MSVQFDTEILADTLPIADEPDASIDAWTLDELDHLADLGSVRGAQADMDE